MIALWASLVLLAATGEPPYPVDVTQATLADPAEVARLETPGEVFFTDGFESDESLDNWFNFNREDQKTQIVYDPNVAHTGRGALQLTTEDRDGESSGAGASHWFVPGRERVYYRRYIRFADDYDQGNLHHVGGSLYAVAGDNKWAEMGKAGIRPNGDDRFGAAFEPWRDWKRNPAPGAMMLYTYWMDMKPDPSGPYYGNNLMPPKDRQTTLERGRWHCLEHAIFVNTPGEADGEMAAWIDGTLYTHLKGFRWRTTDDVSLKRISAGLYVHQSRRVNRVWYDDVALSSGYIGRSDATALPTDDDAR